MAKETRPEGRILRRLAWAGITTFLLISAFDIHRWRRDPWQDFDARFVELAQTIFGQDPSPVWLYALAFPIVAINFGCHVQILRDKRGRIALPFIVSALAIAMMPLAGGQFAVVYTMIWPEILRQVGYGIGGAIAAILLLDLDYAAHRAKAAPRLQDG